MWMSAPLTRISYGINGPRATTSLPCEKRELITHSGNNGLFP